MTPPTKAEALEALADLNALADAFIGTKSSIAEEKPFQVIREKAIKTLRALIELSSREAEMEWLGRSLVFNKRAIGAVSFGDFTMGDESCHHQVYMFRLFKEAWSGPFKTEDEAKSAAWTAAQQWLSPLAGRDIWRHVKRGTLYTVIGNGKAQASVDAIADDDDVTVYQGEDGKIWVRRTAEFNDGRFVRATPKGK